MIAHPEDNIFFNRKPDADIPLPRRRGSLELGEFLDGVADGSIVNIPWPWKLLTNLTQALMPGTVSMICGDGGIGKTFLLMQCIRFWESLGVSHAVYFVEKNLKFHLMRLLAQLEGRGCFTSIDWLHDNAEEVTAARMRHEKELDALSRRITCTPEKMLTLDDILKWAIRKAETGTRIIMVDPITAVSAGDRRWTKDDEFIFYCQSKMSKYGASLILTTHPKTGTKPGGSSAGEQAGGSAYHRFTDTTIWVHRTPKPKSVHIVDHYGNPLAMKLEIFFQLRKVRLARGSHKEIGYIFGDGLAYAEQGLVTAEMPQSNLIQEDKIP